MEDMKKNVVNEIIKSMGSELNDAQLSKLKDILYIKLHDYELSKQSTELSTCDEEYLIILRKFLAVKSLENKSKRTIKYYSDTLKKMLCYMNKNVIQITTDDLRYYLSMYKQTRDISDVTLDNIKRIFCSFFNWLEIEDYIEKSPTRKLNKIKVNKKEIKIMKDFIQNIDWYQVMSVLWTVILLPLLRYAIQFAKTKIGESKAKSIEKYTNMLFDSVENVVKDVQDSVVKDIKGTDKWTPETIREVKNIATNKAISSMSAQGYHLLTQCNADFDEWLDSVIEAKLYDLKQSK